MVGLNGKIQVKCKICSQIKRRDKFLSSKLDALYKHSSKKKVLEDTLGQPKGTIYFEVIIYTNKMKILFSFRSQLMNVFQHVCVGIEG